ncbi:B12-binding domain-containing radical SAM protein [Marinomonas mediterranea]|jgi:Fe-S oxidoreductase|uniref:Radical SAM domain protein n=1 Tax=Marinomonas mediterranea (strain ATCC 700492 / JCM 21426 / NBRC 103028 / MMB-1) TaxID=717774 RepID=F2K500_MARM1|nr:B12-binding domain-containing radical SAM protein [Marinomonas mediterranea]ADZ92643.1 Radical SAM domain protein [Marinomonas mediterranea MMB-1]WCN14632.1 B12-binding domain-containing radical SAM protein [Marinomonas mediterranea]WCN18679.1 B12-binding domain-containing radical SAM protein [Marinomonas mediterranea MMB-1]
MTVLLMTPPMTQLNTPYPATAYLTGFLRSRNYDAIQRDPAIELFLEMMTSDGLDIIRQHVEDNFEQFNDDELPDVIYAFLSEFDRYSLCVEPVIRFLQGKDPSLALRIVSRRFLPEGPAFDAIEQMTAISGDVLQNAFGDLGVQDKAKYLATLFINDLSAVITQGVDPHFEVSRYGERLAAANPSFDDLYDILMGEPSFSSEILEQLVELYLEETQPSVVALTVPFPGNMLGALRIAQTCKAINPDIAIVMGGGFVNTELRALKDPRVFEFVDFICVDDGERPFMTLLEYLDGQREVDELVRTYCLAEDENGELFVHFNDNKALHDIPQTDVAAPVYDGLPLNDYLSLCEMLNPMHRIWSDGRWNKLTIAHGCYWRKCSFCDVSLDYIDRYDAAGADILVDRIEQLIEETGQTGFHFVDEAAPPKALFALANRLIERGVVISWWGNIRFEKTFTPERCQLLADSGCIAVSGGLEVASDRLLKLMKKGVSVEQVARVTKGFSDAGILVHAYLMYGFPTQTEQETIDSLEMVRQMMSSGCFQSAYWHRFAATIHSPIGINPDDYGITLADRPETRFAENDVDFFDPIDTDHDMLGRGLRKSLYNYMHGIGFDQPMNFWFDQPVSKTSVKKSLIENAINNVIVSS